MSEQRNWKRIRDRVGLQLPVRVRVRETPDFERTEMTRLLNVTPLGAMVHAAVALEPVGADGIARIHVEFIDREWPL